MNYRSLSDSDLRDRFSSLVAGERRTTAALVAHLEEIDRRELWAADGYSGLTKWCVDRYAMSASQAGKRVRAARLSRRFPVILAMLERGEIHLGTLNVLGARLTNENHREVLTRAVHKTEDDLALLAVELAPKPDVPSRVVPIRAVAQSRIEAPAAALALPVVSPAPVVKPLSPDRYKVQLMIDGRMLDKLRELEDLMAHSVPDRDLAAIVDRAFDALLEKVRRARKAQTNRPAHPKRTPSEAAKSRVPSALVTRTVWKRDESSCAFVSTDGHRCGSRRMLELHHRVPFAKGGPTTIENLELRCRPHNQHEANRDYGTRFMNEKRQSVRTAASRSRRTSE